MKKYLLFLWMIGTIISCKEDNIILDPCGVLVDGVYQFPDLPQNHNLTHEEVYAFKDLPEDISECITTEGLVETCLNYPFLGLVWASSHSPQAGLGTVWSLFSGFSELSTRPDRSEFLLKKYKTVDPLGYDLNWELVDIGAFTFHIMYIEMIFGQDQNIEPLSLNEEIELIETARNYYNKKFEDYDTHGIYGLSTTASLMARLMLMDNFQPFMDVYDPTDSSWNIVEWFTPSTLARAELIYDLSTEHLEFLINQ